jgi:putative ABC transport system ATP-binding protein
MSLKLTGIRKSYLQGETKLGILTDCELETKPGEVVAVLGESGSGKSTLLSIIAGFDRPDGGEVMWNGQSTTGWDDDRWAEFRRQGLGFVFQDYYLIPYLTALENVLLPLQILRADRETGEKEARRLLHLLGLDRRETHLPAQLSGGECQRVGIARALIHRPGLLLADEPTGSLDAKTGAQVAELMFGLLRETRQTALIVTHSAEVAGRCDRVLTLRQGRLWPS